MKGYFVTNEDGEKEVYSKPPRRLCTRRGSGPGVWFYDRKNSNDLQDCIYLREWNTDDLPDELKNQTWKDDPIEVEIIFKIN